MTAFKRLLAKSSKNPDTPRGAEALAGHTANVLAAAEALLDETADAQLVAVGLSPETWRERFRRGVLIAAFCHDLGKANDQFQAMVRHQREEQQAIRHEALSLLIVQETGLRAWLTTVLEDPDSLDFLLWAAAGHHRKFPPAEPAPGTGVRLSLFLGHPDFRRTLIVGAKWFSLNDPPPLADLNWQLTGLGSPSRRLTQSAVRAAAYWDACTDEQRRFLAVVKACLIAADVAGSALPKEGEKIAPWIREALRRRPTADQLQKIVTDRLQGSSLRPFQNALGATKARVVLAQAGCGSGKTLGAYLWAARRAPGKRLFFSYPTTGTATEGFHDYLIDPTLDAQLVHGLAADTSPVQRRIRQFEALRDPGLAFRLARRLAIARASSQLGFLLRASRGKDRAASGIEDAVQGIRNALRAASYTEGIDSLRGHEGDAGRHYFSGLPVLLREDLDERFHFHGRNRRPPQDRLNALLSFGYALLYRDVLQAILAVGLEPAFGFFHRPRSAAHPLALDLMELFRVPLWDMPLVASVNRMQWDAEEDFTCAGRQVWLSDSGRKKAIEVYERRKEDRWKHPITGYSLSYARLVELEARLLEKEWTGEPGLFARMRLR